MINIIESNTITYICFKLLTGSLLGVSYTPYKALVYKSNSNNNKIEYYELVI